MALPDDGRMDIADCVIVGNAISTMISPALKEAVFSMPLIHVEECPPTTNVIKFRKSGSLVAEAVTEGAVYTPSDANSDINDTSVTATAVKIAVASPLTVEAIRFGAGAADIPRVAAEQARAIGRKFDDDFLALVDSITNVATASTTMSVDTLLEGQYNVYNALVPTGGLAAVLHFKQAYELKKVIASSGAAQYSNQSQISILNGIPQANGFVGNFLGVDIYQTTGLSTTGGDTQGVIFDPRIAFAAAIGGSIDTMVEWTGYGVASNIPGFSYAAESWIFYHIVVWNNTAASELRSDT